MALFSAISQSCGPSTEPHRQDGPGFGENAAVQRSLRDDGALLSKWKLPLPKYVTTTECLGRAVEGHQAWRSRTCAREPKHQQALRTWARVDGVSLGMIDFIVRAIGGGPSRA
jgi:hypothetical protein